MTRGGDGRRAAWILAAIVVVGAALRLYALGTSPPGIHPDAASNAWNARCLRATGQDWNGTSWPLLTARGFGQGQSTLDYYVIMPFQAVLGMNVISTILPSAITGILSILCIGIAGMRLLGRKAGLAAAAVMALAPWHLFLSRWGHESGLVPFLTAAPLAAIALAGLPLTERGPEGARPRWALVAGAGAGLACYGYLALRVFWPAAVGAAALANAAAFPVFVRDRRGRRAMIAFVLAFGVTLGPLAIRHLTDPTIGKRAREYTTWSPDDGAMARIGKVLARYPDAWSPGFLFVHGDWFALHKIPDSGPMRDYTLPLIAAGLVAGFAAARRDPRARAVIALFAVYPLSDALARHVGAHLLRSAPGIVPLCLLAGLGAAAGFAWLKTQGRRVVVIGTIVFTLWCAGSTAIFSRDFFVRYNRDPDIWEFFNADLLEAVTWVKPRFHDADAMFVSMSSSSAMDQPFVIALFGLDYDPAAWFADAKDVEHRADTDVVRSVGKIHFLFERKDVDALYQLAANGRPDHVIIIARPGEWHRGEPVYTVYLPDGRPSYLIYDLQL